MLVAMTERCSECGKKARMTWPALAAPLCSKCCGTGRGVRIDCTPDCAVNPFGKAAYPRYQEMASGLVDKLFKRMVSEGYDYGTTQRDNAAGIAAIHII